MTGMTFRRRLTVLAASSLLLAGCAVPGEGTPGVAAVVDGETLTSAELDAIAAAWQEDSDGAIVPDRQALATAALFGPDLVEVVAEQDVVITESIATDYAGAWLEFVGVENPDPSETVVESVTNILALYVVANTDPGGDVLRTLVDGVDEDAEFSPRLGELSADAFVESAQSAIGTAEVMSLGNYAFTPFIAVSAFTDAGASWVARD